MQYILDRLKEKKVENLPSRCDTAHSSRHVECQATMMRTDLMLKDDGTAWSIAIECYENKPIHSAAQDKNDVCQPNSNFTFGWIRLTQIILIEGGKHTQLIICLAANIISASRDLQCDKWRFRPQPRDYPLVKDLSRGDFCAAFISWG